MLTCSMRASSSWRRPCPLVAAVSTTCTLPPTSSSSRPSAISCCRTRLGSACKHQPSTTSTQAQWVLPCMHLTLSHAKCIGQALPYCPMTRRLGVAYAITADRHGSSSMGYKMSRCIAKNNSRESIWADISQSIGNTHEVCRCRSSTCICKIHSQTETRTLAWEWCKHDYHRDITLGECHDNRAASCFAMCQRFPGLWHDPIICCCHQHNLHSRQHANFMVMM